MERFWRGLESMGRQRGRRIVVDNAKAPITKVLIEIWQSVLQRWPIREEDNFFDLGGAPSLAPKLFDKIATKCGRELPPLIIYHAPTVPALAAVMQQPSLPKFPALVPL